MFLGSFGGDRDAADDAAADRKRESLLDRRSRRSSDAAADCDRLIDYAGQALSIWSRIQSSILARHRAQSEGGTGRLRVAFFCDVASPEPERADAAWTVHRAERPSRNAAEILLIWHLCAWLQALPDSRTSSRPRIVIVTCDQGFDYLKDLVQKQGFSCTFCYNLSSALQCLGPESTPVAQDQQDYEISLCTCKT